MALSQKYSDRDYHFVRLVSGAVIAETSMKQIFQLTNLFIS
jgi:hypothetical protein